MTRLVKSVLSCAVLLSVLPAATWGKDPAPPPKNPPAASKAPAKPSKNPLPDAATLRDALKIVNDVYGADISAAKSLDQKMVMARKLTDSAREERDLTTRAAMLVRASDIGVDAGDAGLALSPLRELDSQYSGDILKMMADAVTGTSRNARSPESRRSVAQQAVLVADAAVDADRFELARPVAELGMSSARVSEDTDLAKEAGLKLQEVKESETAFNDAKKFFDTLKENPKDAEANFKVGKYRSLIKGQWAVGLPMLARGSDVVLQELAKKELAGAKGADAQAAIGDAWWTHGDTLTGIAKTQTHMHARAWYAKALPELKGLTKARIEKRVQSGPLASTVKTIDPVVHDSVNKGLRWLAKQQRPDGSWSFVTQPDPGELNAPGTATYMALLAFIRAGHTHRDGDFRPEIERGLTFAMGLIKFKPTGGDMRDGQDMYTQAIGTTMICEAYRRTKDPRLLKPAQQAVKAIVYAQDPKTGGWRYEPRKGGDTSVMGWQMVALKAASDAGIEVPAEVYKGATLYLDSVQIGGGSSYKYEPASKGPGSTSVTAVGLLSRLHCGADRSSPSIMTGVQAVIDRGITDDLYLCYYSTYLVKEWGGDAWTSWEKTMHEKVVKQQDKDGSWVNFKGHVPPKVGRVGMTAMSLWILETAFPTRR